MQLLEQVRQGATAIQAPNLVAQADALAAGNASEANTRTWIIWCPEADLR